MNVRHTMDVLHSFSIKNIFMIKWTSGFFYFDVTKGTMLLNNLSGE